MPFSDFLKLCTTIRSLYNKDLAVAVFEKNIGKFYNLGSFDPKNPALQFEKLPIK